jgi:hypothetical protein
MLDMIRTEHEQPLADAGSEESASEDHKQIEIEDEISSEEKLQEVEEEGKNPETCTSVE